MRTLDKKQHARREEIANLLGSSGDQLRVAIEKFNDDIAAIFDERVAPKLADYNALIEQAEELRDEVYQEIEGNDFDEIDIHAPDPIDMPRLRRKRYARRTP